MADIQELRQKYPQYKDMSDQDFAQHFHDKFYSDMPREEFDKKLGLAPKKGFVQKLGETWPARMAKDLIEAAKMPGRAWGGTESIREQGAVDPLSDEAIGGMTDLAGVVSGGMGKQLGVPARQIKQTGMGKLFGTPKEEPMPQPHGLHQEGIVMPREGPAPEYLSEAGEAHMAEYGQQAAKQSREAASEITRSFDPKGVARTPEQAGVVVSDAVQRAAALHQQSIDRGFRTAIGGEKPAAINAAAFTVIPQNIVADLTANRIGVETKYASEMLQVLTREVARLSTGNQGGPAAGAYGNVNLATIDKLKRSLKTQQRAAMEAGRNAPPGSPKAEDIKASRAVLESFNNHLDQIVNSKAFVGDTAKVKAWNIGREHETLFSEKFESSGHKSVGEVVQKVIGENKYDPATATRVGDHLWGGIGVLPDHFNVAVAKRFRSILGPNSQEWAAAQQQFWQKITDIGKTDDWQPRLMKDRILEALDGSGKAVMNEVFSPQKRAIFRDFANTQGTLDLAMRATGMTGQTAAQVSGKMAAEVSKGLQGVADGVVQGVGKAAAYAMERKELADLQRKFPIIRKATEEWWAEVQRAQKQNPGDPAGQRRSMFAATTGYAEKLRKVGIGIGTRPTVTVPRRGEDKLSPERAMGGPAM